MRPTVKIARLRKSALPLPAYQSEHAAGIDLMADIGASIEMAPRERRAVPTGIAVEIPVGYEGQVRPRSGRALKEGLALINSPGTVDADYRGEVKVLLVNLGDQPIPLNRAIESPSSSSRPSFAPTLSRSMNSRQVRAAPA